MDDADDNALPRYGEEPTAAGDEAPTYEATTTVRTSTRDALGTTLTIDPTGTSIIQLPLGSGPPPYTLSASLLKVHTGSSVDVRRADKNGGDPLAVYAIAEQFITPLHSVPRRFKNVVVRNSHGLFVKIGLRKVVWDFMTQSPIPLKDGKVDWQAGDENGGFLVTLSGDIGVRKDLLEFREGKWTDENNEVLALAREGGAECRGMPVLSIVKDLDQEMMDFLVSCWCVTLWRDVGKRAHHYKATQK